MSFFCKFNYVLIILKYFNDNRNYLNETKKLFILVMKKKIGNDF